MGAIKRRGDYITPLGVGDGRLDLRGGAEAPRLDKFYTWTGYTLGGAICWAMLHAWTNRGMGVGLLEVFLGEGGEGGGGFEGGEPGVEGVEEDAVAGGYGPALEVAEGYGGGYG